MTEKKRAELDEKKKPRGRSLSSGYPNTSDKTSTFFYVKKMPDSDCGIIIYNLVLTAKTVEEELELDWKINGVVEIVPNSYCRGYKMSRKKELEMDIFRVLNINTNYAKSSPAVYFEDAINSIDFVLKHKKFNKYTAYMDLFNITEIEIPKDGFFMMYMYLYAEDPSVELVVKMGMYDFCTHLLKK